MAIIWKGSLATVLLENILPEVDVIAALDKMVDLNVLRKGTNKKKEGTEGKRRKKRKKPVKDPKPGYKGLFQFGEFETGNL